MLLLLSVAHAISLVLPLLLLLGMLPFRIFIYLSCSWPSAANVSVATACCSPRQLYHVGCCRPTFIRFSMFGLTLHAGCTHCFTKWIDMFSLDTFCAVFFFLFMMKSWTRLSWMQCCWPLNSRSAIKCNVLVGCKQYRIVGCLLHKIIQFKPRSFCNVFRLCCSQCLYKTAWAAACHLPMLPR